VSVVESCASAAGDPSPAFFILGRLWPRLYLGASFAFGPWAKLYGLGSSFLREFCPENIWTPWASPPPRFSCCELSAVSCQPLFIPSGCRDARHMCDCALPSVASVLTHFSISASNARQTPNRKFHPKNRQKARSRSFRKGIQLPLGRPPEPTGA
jgi:hypothetical protein